MFLPKARSSNTKTSAELHNGDVYLTHGRTQLADQSWRAKRTKRRPYGLRQPRWALPRRPSDRSPDGLRGERAERDSGTPRRGTDHRGKADARIGEVRVHKRVVVEKKQYHHSGDARRGLHRARGGGRQVPATDPRRVTFVESTVTIPLHEGELQIFKRPVIREEVRVTRQRAPGRQDHDGRDPQRGSSTSISRRVLSEHLHMHRSP